MVLWCPQQSEHAERTIDGEKIDESLRPSTQEFRNVACTLARTVAYVVAEQRRVVPNQSHVADEVLEQRRVVERPAVYTHADHSDQRRFDVNIVAGPLRDGKLIIDH